MIQNVLARYMGGDCALLIYKQKIRSYSSDSKIARTQKSLCLFTYQDREKISGSEQQMVFNYRSATDDFEFIDLDPKKKLNIQEIFQQYVKMKRLLLDWNDTTTFSLQSTVGKNNVLL